MSSESERACKKACKKLKIIKIKNKIVYCKCNNNQNYKIINYKI